MREKRTPGGRVPTGVDGRTEDMILRRVRVYGFILTLDSASFSTLNTNDLLQGCDHFDQISLVCHHLVDRFVDTRNFIQNAIPAIVALPIADSAILRIQSTVIFTYLFKFIFW
jgi:hypothetical protein